MKRHYKYQIEGEGEVFEFKSIGSSDWETGRLWIAEEAAENYYAEHFGWHDTWPLEISLYDGDTYLGRYSVDQRSRPQFTANQVEAGVVA